MILENNCYYRREIRKLKRLKDGHICFIAEEEKGEIAGYCWVAFEEIYLGEIRKKWN